LVFDGTLGEGEEGGPNLVKYPENKSRKKRLAWLSHLKGREGRVLRTAAFGKGR